ncbi:MAG: hypothetical protein C4525_00560 [Desulfarculus sp.]|jgi:hypothetical protein|nr:MAG: hypothetical protein C4525_00560 [Desulfarculus sp.]
MRRRGGQFVSFLFLLIILACGGGGGGGGGDSITSADYAYLYDHNASALGGYTVRWGSSTVSVSANDFPEAQAAINRWNSASSGSLGFTFTGGSANITVRWANLSGVCGVTYWWYTSAGYIVRAEVYINRDQSGCLSGLAATLTHEAAHGSGYFGHDSEGIMGPTSNGATNITGRQGRFFRLLYSMPPGTDIRGYLKLKKEAKPSKYDPSGSRIYKEVSYRWARRAR